MAVFLSWQRGALTRKWNFNEFLNPQAPATLYLDASPWGLGGILVINSQAHSYFACKLTKFDVQLLGITYRGS